jgi:putative MATE family efflux protein
MSQQPRRHLRGDLTQGPIMRTLLAFSIPTLLSNGLQSLNGTVNAIWVGRLIGAEALAATANANIIMFLISAGAFGFGMAGTVKIGQRYGARNLDGARRAFGTAIGFCFILTLFIAAGGWMITPYLLDLLNTPGEAWDLALGYLRMIFLAMPVVMAQMVITMGLRGTGDSRTPLIFMAVTVLLNFILVPLMVAGTGPLPTLGIVGAGLAMTISIIISSAAMVFYIYWRDLPLRLRGHELAYLWPRRDELRFIIAKGVPMGVQMAVMGAAGLIVMGLVNREGMLVTAAYGAALQVFTYIQMPAMAIGGIWI